MPEVSPNAELYPKNYHQTLCPPTPAPGFGDPNEMERVWGQNWGASDEVGLLRMVLMRRPADEMLRIRADCWDERAQALVDPNGMWYWTDRTPPDLPRMQAQHDGLADALRQEGVEVCYVAGTPPNFPKSIYTRDPMITIRGGAMIGRMAPLMRRGEERYVTQTIAALGIPILRTVVGTGMMEGGTFAKLTKNVAVFGTSIRCNAEAARQVEETLRWFGIELIVVPMSGWSIHLDGHFAMVDVDKALVEPLGLPHWFLDRLTELGIETIYRHPDERWAINSLAVRPGRLIMNDSSPYTRERLEQRGIEIVAIPYDEVQKNGGGIHCSTMELLRDDA
jgi:N-dimethylarginine dimethylaminohydrolase